MINISFMVEDAVGGYVVKCFFKNFYWCFWRGIRVFFNVIIINVMLEY